MLWRLAPLLLLALAACDATPSDDPADWPVDTSKTWTPVLGEPRFIIPTHQMPDQATPQLASNNNVDILMHQERLYLAWRTGPNHFASTQTRLHLVSSKDLGQTWDYETSFFLETDLREPHFLSLNGRLLFHFFEAGSDLFSFEPKAQWRSERKDGAWTEKQQWGEAGEITWDLKVRGGVAWRTSYHGQHYQLGEVPDIQVFFTTSKDATTWTPVKGDGVVYTGGVSEVAFEFDENGDLWAVTRNEDGDTTGFGSHVCTAPKGDLGAWSCSEKSDPERYDSPKMFRHGNELFLVARRDVGGPFDLGKDTLSFADKQTQYLAAYWGRPKRTALYRIDREAKKVEWVFDFPSSGDTAFPSLVRLDAHRFLIANYTSPLDADVDRSWLQGQTLEAGTKIYLVELRFDPT